MQQLLEPKLIDLVDGYEKQLIMLRALAKWFLELEELIDLEIGDVGYVLIVSHFLP